MKHTFRKSQNHIYTSILFKQSYDSGKFENGWFVVWSEIKTEMSPNSSISVKQPDEQWL